MQITDDRKEEYVEKLFASIAPRYDLLNSILSLSLHRRWRRFAVNQCRLSPGDTAADVGAGTLDFSIELLNAVGRNGRIVAVDFCRPMLEVGRPKLEARGITNILPVEGNAEHLPIPSSSCRAATIGFVLRNVASVERTLAEMVRVVQPGGRVISLELAKPKSRLFRSVYELYFYRLLPLVGGLVNGDREPYEYLPHSLTHFHSREALSEIMEKVGLTEVKVYDLTGGIVAVHVGTKK